MPRNLLAVFAVGLLVTSSIPSNAAPRVILKDCADLSCGRSPKRVGKVLDVGRFQVLTLVRFRDFFGMKRNFALPVSSSSLSGFGQVFFDGPDCTGSAWVQGGFNAGFFSPAHAVVSDVFPVSVLMEYFEDSLADTPFDSRVSSGGIGGGGSSNANWQDLQGVVRLTVLSGSLIVESIQIDVSGDAGRFSDSFSVNVQMDELDTFVQSFNTLPMVESGTFSTFYSVLGRGIVDLPVRALYAATDDEVVNGNSVSVATGGGCENRVTSFSGVPAEKIVDDLHVSFPPPYRLNISN